MSTGEHGADRVETLEWFPGCTDVCGREGQGVSYERRPSGLLTYP